MNMIRLAQGAAIARKPYGWLYARALAGTVRSEFRGGHWYVDRADCERLAQAEAVTA